MRIEKEPLRRLFHWIKERESIRLKRLDGLPKPWTGDPILQRFRFCNVMRMDDKVSQWLLQNWYLPNYNHPNMVLACALARFINTPEALSDVGFPVVWNAAKVRKVLHRRMDKGQRVFNGAYIVSGSGGTGRGSKIDTVVNLHLKPLHKQTGIANRDSMFETWSNLVGCSGFGSFMAGQVTADLRWAMQGTWADAKTWAPMGPGSRRGMNRLLGQPIDSPLNQAQFLELLRSMIQECESSLPASITDRLEAIDYQNCLCEFDKMERGLWGGGRIRQKYNGVG